MAYEHFIGKEISFTAEPYHGGKAVITRVEKHPMHFAQYGLLILNIKTTDATEVSRLFSATSVQPFNDRELRIYSYTEGEVKDAVENGKLLRHVYPV